MCSLHRFSLKKAVFWCNKRLRQCKPTIVFLPLDFSVYCFDELLGQLSPELTFMNVCLFFSCMSKQSSDFFVTKEWAPLLLSAPNPWRLPFRPPGRNSLMMWLFGVTSMISNLTAPLVKEICVIVFTFRWLEYRTETSQHMICCWGYSICHRDQTFVKTLTFNALWCSFLNHG